MDMASNINRAELIIKRIQGRRLELNLSYQALADRTGLSKSTLQRYETGDIMNIPLSKIDILAQGLQTSPLYLLGWEDKVIEPEEMEIIEAYRAQPQLHEAVGKVLGIYNEDEEYIKFLKEREKYIKSIAQPYAAADGDITNLDEAQRLFDESDFVDEDDEQH